MRSLQRWHGHIFFRSRSGLLSAKLGGNVGWDASRCLQWERFRLVRVDTLIGLGWLRREAWLDGSGRPFRWIDQPLDFGRTLHSEASALAATIAPQELTARRHFWIGRSRIVLSQYETASFEFDDISDPEEITVLEEGASKEKIPSV